MKIPRLKISQSLRQSTWLHNCGTVFETKCTCCYQAKMTVFNFHCAHIVSVAKGGDTNLNNLKPTCSTCNLSMGTDDFYTFQKRMGYKNLMWSFLGYF
jgi:5-methylcytosine-specific restriction endonuclease McrA